MAPPAPAGAAVPDELALIPGLGGEVRQGRAVGLRNRQCAAARLLSLAIFLLFATASALLLLALVLAARAFRRHRGSRYRVPSLNPPPPPTSAAS